MNGARGIREVARAVVAGDEDPASLLRDAAAAQFAADDSEAPLNAFISTALEPSDHPSPPVAGPLSGIPVAVKDNIATRGLPTTCGSHLLRAYHSPFDATAVARLRAAGARIVGKSNLDEFGMGSSTEFSASGPSRNPRDRGRVPGGSSGGSAAAVAAGIVPVALGSETGGSIRQPAAFCGVVGVKPTYGRISRHGLVAFASSLDQVGVLARGVADAALVLRVLSGPDGHDARTGRVSPPAVPTEDGSLEGTVVGVPEEYFGAGAEPGVLRACRRALRALETRGAELREISLPHTRLALSAYQLISSAEASSNLARYDGSWSGARSPGTGSDPATVHDAVRGLFGPEVRRRVLLGTHLLSAGDDADLLRRAGHARALLAEDFRLVFRSGVDVIFTPTTPRTAFPLGSYSHDPAGMSLTNAFVVPANLAGLPALSLPVGQADGLPVGGQLIADAWGEETVLRVALELEVALSVGDDAG